MHLDLSCWTGRLPNATEGSRAWAHVPAGLSRGLKSHGPNSPWGLSGKFMCLSGARVRNVLKKSTSDGNNSQPKAVLFSTNCISSQPLLQVLLRGGCRMLVSRQLNIFVFLLPFPETWHSFRLFLKQLKRHASDLRFLGIQFETKSMFRNSNQ